MNTWPYPRFIAHRGGGCFAPENTLAAFREGASHGYCMFECDVKLSSDNVPHLLHDDTLDRTSTGHGLASLLDWRMISSFDAGSWYSPFYAGEPVPTLEAIAQFCLHNHYALNIEIKPTEVSGEPNTAADAMARHTGKLIAKRTQQLWQNSALKPLISSFKPASLEAAKATAPELPRGLLLAELWEGWLPCAIELECAIVSCDYQLWSAATVGLVKAQGMRCGSYTVNDSAQALRLIDLGIDCIYTDRLDLFPPTP